MGKQSTGGQIRRTPTSLSVRVWVECSDRIRHRVRLPISNVKATDAHAHAVAKKWVAAATGKPWDEIERALRPVKEARDAGVPDLTVDSYFDRWSATRVDNSTHDLERKKYAKHIKPLIGSLPIAAVTPELLRDVVEKLDKKAESNDGSKRGRDSFGPKNAVNVWSSVSKMFADAVGHKEKALRVLVKNPAAGVKGPDGPKDETDMQWLYPDELVQLLACHDVPLARRRLYFGDVGIFGRAGEALALLWGRGIDVERGLAHVVRAYDSREGVFQEYTKTRDARHFKLEPAVLRLYRALWDDAGRPAARADALVFDTVGHLAENLRRDLWTAHVRRDSLHVRRPGSQPIRFHDLRATGLSYLGLLGRSDDEIRQRAGHADFKTTLLYIERARHVAGADFGVPFEGIPDCLFERERPGAFVAVPIQLRATEIRATIRATGTDGGFGSVGNQTENVRAGEGIRIFDGVAAGQKDRVNDASPCAADGLARPSETVVAHSWPISDALVCDLVEAMIAPVGLELEQAAPVVVELEAMACVALGDRKGEASNG
jgi:integrase